MNNSTRSYKICQPLHEEISLSLGAFFSNRLSITDFEVLDLLYSLRNKYGNNIYKSQTSMARDLGYCRETINRSINRLRSFGIIWTMSGTKQTCLYYLHEFFTKNSTRKNLSSFMRYYVSFSLSLLIPTPEVTQVKLDVLKTNLVSSSSIRESNSNAGARAREIRHEYEKKERLNEQTLGRNALEASARLMKLQENFPITPHGLITLSVFPEQAIDHAESMLNKAIMAQQPFGYFLSLCKNYCKSNGISFSWRPYYERKQALNIDNDAPTIDMEILLEIRKRLEREAIKKPTSWNKNQTQQRERPKPIPHVETEKEAKTRIFLEEFDTTFKFVNELERAMHAAVVNDPSREIQLDFPPRWNSLSVEQQMEIMANHHTQDCRCGNILNRNAWKY